MKRRSKVETQNKTGTRRALVANRSEKTARSRRLVPARSSQSEGRIARGHLSFLACRVRPQLLKANAHPSIRLSLGDIDSLVGDGEIVAVRDRLQQAHKYYTALANSRSQADLLVRLATPIKRRLLDKEPI